MATKPEQLINWKEEYEIDLDKDIVFIGNRESGHALGIVSSSIHRRILGNLFNLYVKSKTSLTMKDTQCGFKLYPTHIAKQAFTNLIDYGFGHDVEVLVKISMNGIEIRSLPVRWNAVDGSKINLFKDGFKMLSHVTKVARKYK